MTCAATVAWLLGAGAGAASVAFAAAPFAGAPVVVAGVAAPFVAVPLCPLFVTVTITMISEVFRVTRFHAL